MPFWRFLPVRLPRRSVAGFFLARTLTLAACLLLAAFIPSTAWGVFLGGGAKVVFATADEGRRILTTRDDFIERMSPFDRAARMKTDAVVPEDVFLRFVGTNVLDWTPTEMSMVNASLERLRSGLERLSLPFPKTTTFIKTTGNEEGGAQYTRQNAVILNANVLGARDGKALDQCVAHELFHVLSRQNPALRDKCYAAIGFQKCDEVDLPADLRLQRLTNPDAPRNDHFIRVTIQGRPAEAVPLIYSKSPKYDVGAGGEFFGYLQFKFLVTDKAAPAGGPAPVFTAKNSRLVDPGQISGFYEQIGKNTGYIIHPEEILADNFSMLLRGETAATSPEILDRLQTALKP